jgi:hypothetical protein
MRTTPYFEEQVLRKRPYIRREWCAAVVANPLRREVQTDGRVRYRGAITDDRGGDSRIRILRVVTLADGQTVHNAFFDRRFRGDRP